MLSAISYISNEIKSRTFSGLSRTFVVEQVTLSWLAVVAVVAHTLLSHCRLLIVKIRDLVMNSSTVGIPFS